MGPVRERPLCGDPFSNFNRTAVEKEDMGSRQDGALNVSEWEEGIRRETSEGRTQLGMGGRATGSVLWSPGNGCSCRPLWYPVGWLQGEHEIFPG